MRGTSRKPWTCASCDLEQPAGTAYVERSEGRWYAIPGGVIHADGIFRYCLACAEPSPASIKDHWTKDHE